MLFNYKRSKDGYQLGFTLSEVLIALAIIAVIASITIPVLLNITNGKENEAAFKKAILALNEALNMEYATKGTGANSYKSSNDVVEKLFKKRMNTLSTDEKFTGNVCAGGSVFITIDGMMFCVDNWEISTDPSKGKCNNDDTVPCASDFSMPNIWIDINGKKKPNAVTDNAKKPQDIYQAMSYSIWKGINQSFFRS